MTYLQTTLFVDEPSLAVEGLNEPAWRPRRKRAKTLHEALEPFVDLGKLRQLAATQGNLEEALRSGEIPDDVAALLVFLGAVLRPAVREQLKSPAETAAYLMTRIGLLDQEEAWTILLNAKLQIMKVHRVYIGNINSTGIRIGEIFREAIRINAAALIFCHNHPSGVVDPSTQDILVTRQLVAAGKLLDISVLDHLIVGRGRWASLRERGQGFSKR